MNSESIQPAQLDISLARAAIHVEESTESGPCPDDERLAAFMAGALRENDRESVVSHLNRCPACYRQWMEAAADLEEVAQTAHTQTSTGHETPSVIEKFKAWLVDWRLWVPALATACLIAAVLLWPSRDGIEERIESAYASVGGPSMDSNARNAVRDFPLPWEGSSLGFSEAEPSPAAAAFRRGLLDGQHRLLQSVTVDTVSRPSSSEADKTYIQLGRWMLLLWTQLGSHTETIDWAWQRDTGAQIVAQMRSLPRRDASDQAVDIVASIVGRLTAAQPNEKTARDALQRSIIIAAQQLAYM